MKVAQNQAQNSFSTISARPCHPIYGWNTSNFGPSSSGGNAPQHDIPSFAFLMRQFIVQPLTPEKIPMVTFPDEWRALSQPHVRSELIKFLKSAMDPSHSSDRSELEALVHFIFDDHDFAPDAKVLIGLVLFDSSEAELINPFVNALDHAIGPGKSWPRNIANVSDVCTAAEAAHRTLTRRGEAKFWP